MCLTSQNNQINLISFYKSFLPKLWIHKKSVLNRVGWRGSLFMPGKKSVFLQFAPKKMVHFHLDIEILVQVVWKWHTHENKGIGLYFQAMVVKKYLHTQAQPQTLLKAHCMCEKRGNLRAFCEVCGCACVCKYFLATML